MVSFRKDLKFVLSWTKDNMENGKIKRMPNEVERKEHHREDALSIIENKLKLIFFIRSHASEIVKELAFPRSSRMKLLHFMLHSVLCGNRRNLFRLNQGNYIVLSLPMRKSSW